MLLITARFDKFLERDNQIEETWVASDENPCPHIPGRIQAWKSKFTNEEKRTGDLLSKYDVAFIRHADDHGALRQGRFGRHISLIGQSQALAAAQTWVLRLPAPVAPAVLSSAAVRTQETARMVVKDGQLVLGGAEAFEMLISERMYFTNWDAANYEAVQTLLKWAPPHSHNFSLSDYFKVSISNQKTFEQNAIHDIELVRMAAQVNYMKNNAQRMTLLVVSHDVFTLTIALLLGVSRTLDCHALRVIMEYRTEPACGLLITASEVLVLDHMLNCSSIPIGAKRV